MKDKPPVLIDHQQAGRAIFERLVKLALLLGDLRLALLERGDVVNPEDPLAAHEADMAAPIGDLHI